MKNSTKVMIDGNEAAAQVAYQMSEVIAIYPITPSSTMGEWADQWSADGKPNIWGSVPRVIEMQSEAGAAGAVHGALQAGCLTTTFTASQGLLLMIPNMYKIAGELTPTVIHVAARTVATQALSIFCDHSDVMACRQTGWAMLASNSVQEAMDFAAIAHAATLEARLPFLHFFDGFRTSHEVMKIKALGTEILWALVSSDRVREHRARALSPDHPVIRGTTHNPDVHFQARESVNAYYLACPEIVQSTMDALARLTGRHYRLFDYVGAPDAERVLVLMGSAAEAAEEAVEKLTSCGEKVGLIKVRLYRPFSIEHFAAALPRSVRRIAVLDRTKEPGCIGEPLYLDVLAAVQELAASAKLPCKVVPQIVGGRYGISSKEFTPAMVKAIFDELDKAKPRNHFTIGIRDDVTHTSLDYDPSFTSEDPATFRGIFYGLGADGTVGANKNTIKIIGGDTNQYAQGYFVYDSKKSGSMTVSHLRFGSRPIRSTYLIDRANFIACHQFAFLDRADILKPAQVGATLLLNSPYKADEVWDKLPHGVQQQIIDKKLRLFVIDAHRVSKDTGMGGRINTIMQTCFFAVSGVLKPEEAIAAIKRAIAKTYGNRGDAVVQKNYAAVDATLDHLQEVQVPAEATSPSELLYAIPTNAPSFVRRTLAPIISGHGDELPVSALPVDGTYPTGTTKWEKRNVGLEIPVWDKDLCIQCGKCVLVCPHAAIRSKVYDPDLLAEAPAAFASTSAHWRDFNDLRYTLQVAPEDCTGCRLCVEVCPAKDKQQPEHKAINMQPQAPLRAVEAVNWDFFLQLPEPRRDALDLNSIKDVQLLQPLFEFSGACAGCGETPYLKLLTQLFGDRMLVANATGCSSIYGGNLPTTPWTSNRCGQGPAWANSLFEDNAEFGLGMRLAIDKQRIYARELLEKLRETIDNPQVQELLDADVSSEPAIAKQRERVARLKQTLHKLNTPNALDLLAVADALVPRSVWIIGGDGWAYDIGYGGLDHVLASGQKVNILVLDTEVYSNTGGQMSKSTPRGAVAKFATGGKSQPKKDLALMAMTYGSVYVARVAMGGNDTHTLKVFREAEAYPGPSLVIAYSHCIAHGYDLSHGIEHQKEAVQCGYWPLFRYNPALKEQGKNPFQLDSRPPSLSLQTYALHESRYTMLAQAHPDISAELLAEAQDDVNQRWQVYQQWGSILNNNKVKPTS